MSAKHLPPIVAFAGWPGAGKNTAAQALVQLGYREDSFAAPLKAMAEHCDPVVYIGEMMTLPESVPLSTLVARYGWDGAKGFPSVRRYLQDLGKAVRDHLGADAWVDSARRRYIDDVDPSGYPKPTVITDCRYPNEAAWVHSVARPTYPPDQIGSGDPIHSVLVWLDRDGCGPPNDHESASGVCRELADHIVSNNGTVEELHAEVLRVLGLEVAR